MHWLDRLAAKVIMPRRARLQFFHDGWGDPDLLDHYRAEVRTVIPHPEINPGWRRSPEREDDDLEVWDGEFRSPAPNLPEWSREAHTRLVFPRSGPPVTRCCLLMAAWNDHGYATRTLLARRLAPLGIASVMLDNPYLGKRRPPGDDLHPVATVADFAVMGRAATIEGAALLSHLRAAGLPGTRSVEQPALGVSGYSMGGNLAAFVATAMRFPVAAAPLAASHSPSPVLTEGVIRHVIDWEALSTVADPLGELRDFMDNISVLLFPPPPHTATAVMVAGDRDGYIPGHAVEALHDHWPGSLLQWTTEGHAGMLLWRKATLAGAVVRAFDRFEAVYAPV
jgi:hypothetical protein